MSNFININNFKGLREDIDYADLPADTPDDLENLNTDNPEGKLELREGSRNKYDRSFTTIRGVYEHKFPTSGATHLIVIDNSVMEVYNGSTWSEPSLPSGAAIDNGTFNHFHGDEDSVRITTGNGSTNYVLWYGYTKRDTADNDGLFGDALDDNGTYRLMKSQLICENGMFDNVHNAIYHDGFYYFGLGPLLSNVSGESKWVEKRDSDFHLVDRFEVEPDTTDNKRVSLSSDGTNIFAGIEDDLYKITTGTSKGWQVTNKVSLGGSDIHGIGQDANDVFVTTDDHIYKRDLSDLTADADTSTSVTNAYDIAVEVTGDYFYVIYLDGSDYKIQQRNKSDLAVNATSAALGTTCHQLYLDEDNSILYVADDSGNVYEVDTSDLSKDDTHSVVSSAVQTFVKVGGTTARAITKKGLVENFTSADLIYPNKIALSFNTVNKSSGNIDQGTFWYKASIVDREGQEFTLSDPIVLQATGTSNSAYINVIFNNDQVAEAYRISHINIYRAYSSETDADIPATNYKFLKKIDINDSAWEYSTIGFYDYLPNAVSGSSYPFFDNTGESTISSVTYLENSGIGENVLPRFINYKYLTWLDSQLHVANFNYDGRDYTNTVIRTPLNQPDNVAFYDIYQCGEDGYSIKGIHNAYGRSFVFKEPYIYVFYDGRQEHVFTPGITSEKGYVKAKDVVYYQHESGLYYINGNTQERINNPIIDSWGTLTNRDYGALFYQDDKDRLLVCFPASKTFMINLKNGRFHKYSTRATFYGYIKNGANEYLGWDGSGIYKISSSYTKDKIDYDGSNGYDITITYNSGLFRASEIHGLNIELFYAFQRCKFTGALTFTLYKYTAAGRTQVNTGTITSPTGDYVYPKKEYFSGAWGETFSFHLTGAMTAFSYNGITFEYKPIGMASD